MDELADSIDGLDLVRLEAADEVPAKRVSVLGVLGLQVLGAILADHLDAGLREEP